MSVSGFLYGYLAWELGHFVAHWSCHKVRLLWCLHSTHHAPTHMNLAVANANFFYQAAYSIFVKTAVCSALGVTTEILVLIAVIDACWGGLIHVSEEAWRKGRLPSFLNKIILSPIHHRIHHGCNPEYIDKNYCNTLPLWDKVFGTFQDEIKGVPVRYGVTRGVKEGCFFDLYFGEFLLLGRDLVNADSAREVMLYLFMPPGWTPRRIADERAPQPLGRG